MDNTNASHFTNPDMRVYTNRFVSGNFENARTESHQCVDRAAVSVDLDEQYNYLFNHYSKISSQFFFLSHMQTKTESRPKCHRYDLKSNIFLLDATL